MKIVHLCLTTMYDTAYAYQDNLLPKYQRKEGHEVTVITTIYRSNDPQTGRVRKSPLRKEMTAEGVKVLRLLPSLPEPLNRHIHLYRGISGFAFCPRPCFDFLPLPAAISSET